MSSIDAPIVVAFAPGRVNLIGEHTDYNAGWALPFALTTGISVRAELRPDAVVAAVAVDLGGARDTVRIGASPGPASGWRAFVRGAVAELRRAGHELHGASLRISGALPRGAGLSSSAALSVALCLALLGVSGQTIPADADGRIALARVCAEIERRWVGVETGLLDQLACLLGGAGEALLIDFRGPTAAPVPLALGDHVLAVLDSGVRRSLVNTGYARRRAECAAACEALGVDSLREVPVAALAGLPDPLLRRARHVIGENARVHETVRALRAGDLVRVGGLLDASHVSLRDDFAVSVPAVEDARRVLLAAGALGARLIGGGFGGSVLALMPPGAPLPAGAVRVAPGRGADCVPEGSSAE